MPLQESNCFDLIFCIFWGNRSTSIPAGNPCSILEFLCCVGPTHLIKEVYVVHNLIIVIFSSVFISGDFFLADFIESQDEKNKAVVADVSHEFLLFCIMDLYADICNDRILHKVPKMNITQNNLLAKH